MAAARADFGELQDLVRRLRDGLARFDDHRATQYVDGGGHLSGYTRGRWEEARQWVNEARDVLRRHEASNDHQVGDARRALAHAADVVDAALDLAERIDVARSDLVRQVDDIVHRAQGVGATDVAATAGELSRRISRDPLEGAHERTLRSTQVDLAVAEASARLEECRSAAAAATKLVRRATKGIAGFTSPPLPDLASPARSLARLRAAAASHDPGSIPLHHRAERLMDDLARERARIRAVVKAAGEVLDRRDDLRGWMRALTRRALVLGVSTERRVGDAHRQLDGLLWSAGCDLDEAERLLIRLTRMLDRELAREEVPDA